MHGYAKMAHVRDYFVVVFLLVLLFLAYTADHRIVAPERVYVTIGNTAVAVELAKTPAERARGLSGRPFLPEGEGMLFIFDYPDRFHFWMPDMHFAIDIIWIGPDWRIVDISPNVSPQSYPNRFTPGAPTQYVLEVSAGSAMRFGWKVGDEVRSNDIVLTR